MLKNLTEKELREVLNSSEVFPSIEDLRNIWVHTHSIAKEGLDDILKVLKSLIQKYLDNDIYVRIDECIWKYLLYDGNGKKIILNFVTL
ncbi:hypothetical protein PFBG_06120 [Plasmodium falciparum 7G8]|uniref:Plasmodium RESA N-terminal domain-containing protein n=2 Tax=Plasmodium falciparum TaxID=5833 RepID=A0A024UXH9_PLAFA|nr:hypothetical protein PFFVO_06119 [Plasmodium falciparum Vietnam Oak-Knoll (FVO)]EUR49169.1 hypothetical protein PFBG_06120 [Plasmodium falciparum 7G8]